MSISARSASPIAGPTSRSRRGARSGTTARVGSRRCSPPTASHPTPRARATTACFTSLARDVAVDGLAYAWRVVDAEALVLQPDAVVELATLAKRRLSRIAGVLFVAGGWGLITLVAVAVG